MLFKFLKQVDSQKLLILSLFLLIVANFSLYNVQQQKSKTKEVETKYLFQANNELRDYSKYALLVGVSEYSKKKVDLSYANSDAQQLLELLKTVGFEENSKELITKETTKKEIIKGFETHLSELANNARKAGYKKNDIIFFYSGHGSNVDENFSTMSNAFYGDRLSLEFDRQEKSISEKNFLIKKSQISEYYSYKISLLNNTEELRLFLTNDFKFERLSERIAAISKVFETLSQIRKQGNLLSSLINYSIIIALLGFVIVCLIPLIKLIKTTLELVDLVSKILINWKKEFREANEYSMKKKNVEKFVIIPTKDEIEYINSNRNHKNK